MIRDRLTDAAVPLGRARDAGTAGASYQPFGEDDQDGLLEALAEHDEALLARLVDDGFAATARTLDLPVLLAGEVARGDLHPVLSGLPAPVPGSPS